MINPNVNYGGGAAELATTSASLLAQARAKDPEAWERLAREYAPGVYSWCRGDGVTAEDAADITQEILLSVFLKLEGFVKENENDSFRGWLRRVAQNRVRDHWRRAGRQLIRAAGGASLGHRLRRLAADPSTDSVDRRILEVVEATERVRVRCRERTWEIFSYYVVDGFTAEETSAAFDVSVGYVHQVRARVLRRFREELDKLKHSSSSQEP